MNDPDIMREMAAMIERFAENWGPKGEDDHRQFRSELADLLGTSYATALGRANEPPPETQPDPDAYHESIDALELPVRALGGLCRGLEDQTGISYRDSRRLSWRAILDLYPRRIKNFGAISFVQVCEALHYRGLPDEELRQSRWWISAQSPWRSRWRVRRESITGQHA